MEENSMVVARAMEQRNKNSESLLTQEAARALKGKNNFLEDLAKGQQNKASEYKEEKPFSLRRSATPRSSNGIERYVLLPDLLSLLRSCFLELLSKSLFLRTFLYQLCRQGSDSFIAFLTTVTSLPLGR
eukprot:1228229-Amphidinium_carterae.1